MKRLIQYRLSHGFFPVSPKRAENFTQVSDWQAVMWQLKSAFRSNMTNLPHRHTGKYII